jgi:hypothetical protein
VPTSARDRYLSSLAHIDSAYTKITAQVGRGGVLSFPDVHKLTEGLFLSAWTYWEGFLRQLLWLDLSASPNSVLISDVKKFRTKKAPHRLAELILNHPDHPDKFVEWSDYNNVVKRANEFLGAGHRFVNPLPQGTDIAQLKRIRNAIAHKSDRAWDSFISLVGAAPFSLARTQRRGLTPGRFLYSHQWNGVSVMQNSVASLRAAAGELVP